MKNQNKKATGFLAQVLRIFILVFLAQSMAYADGGTMSGSGTALDPYLVADYADLKAVGTTYSLSAVYTLTADIDASASATENSGAGFMPIGTNTTPFTGTFHGSGHVVRHLSINRPSTSYIGLFGYLGSGLIDSLGLIDCSIFGNQNTGSLLGYNSGTVSKCFSTGTISGYNYTGGFIGANNGTVTGCYASCSATNSNNYTGGLIGLNWGGSVSSCYATGPVSAVNWYVGGLVGHHNGGTISGCYATGTASGGRYVAGLVGYNAATVGGTISYWNKEIMSTGIGYPLGTSTAVGLTTAQMKQSANFSGWDFTNVWKIRADSTYPGLRYEDNAPFAFADTLSSNRTFLLSRLLLNDCDVETARNNLTLRIISASQGVTDSINTLTFPQPITRGAVSTVRYRVGEIRAADTLWGNIATAIITYNLMDGNGTTPDPYLVETYNDLKNISTLYGLDKVYVLVADIDASPSASENSGAGFAPIGTESSHFTGTFHGRGHVVKNLTINRPSINGVALFGWNNGTIDSLGVINAYITGYSYHTGCLVGWNGGMVKACYATGSVTGSQFVGCLAGTNGNGGTVSDCYATGSVVSSNGCAGGLVGYNINSSSTVIRCYATGSVTDGSSNGAGGLVGYNSNGSLISQSYASGYVAAPGRVGGLVGWNSNCTTNSSYWNTETSGHTSGCGQNDGSFSATGLTTGQMKNSSNFSGWDFSSIWRIRIDSTYPGLRAIDNAPFAFADTLSTGKTFLLSRLLLNDYDIETMHSNLTLHVMSTSRGTTDSVSMLTFPDPIVPGTVSTVKYRVGEIRTADTLWGNIAAAIVAIDSIPPAPPQNLVVMDSSSLTIAIKWRKNAETDFMRYRIYRSTSPNPTTIIDSTTGGSTDTVKTFTGLVDGIRYYFRVTAIDSVWNESGFSNEVNAIPADRIPPASPQNLAVTDSSSQTITITWQRNVETDFMLYRIYRDGSPNPTTKVDSAMGGTGDTVKTLTSLINGTRYFLRVTAVDSVGNESGFSNEVNAIPADRIAPALPQNLVVTDSLNQTLVLKWHKITDADFILYRMYRGTSPNPTIKVDSMTGGMSDTTKIFTGLSVGTRYYFRVTAVDNAGNESGYSNEVNAVPQTNIMFTDGSLYTAPNAASNTNDNPVGRFKLTAEANGATLTSVTVAISGSFSNITSIKLWSSIDSIFGGDSKLDSVNYSSSPVVLSGSSSAIDTGGTYFFITVDLGASSGNIIAAITANADINLAAGTVTGTITNAPLAGNSTLITGVDNEDQLAPRVFALAQNYPNPFNPATTITFSLAGKSYASLRIFNILGQEVAALVSQELPAGTYRHQWNASALSSGVYFYKLEAGIFSAVKKLLLLK